MRAYQRRSARPAVIDLVADEDGEDGSPAPSARPSRKPHSKHAAAAAAVAAAAAADELLSGRAAAELDARREAVAVARGLPDASGVRLVGRDPRDPSQTGNVLFVDSRRVWQQRKATGGRGRGQSATRHDPLPARSAPPPPKQHQQQQHPGGGGDSSKRKQPPGAEDEELGGKARRGSHGASAGADSREAALCDDGVLLVEVEPSPAPRQPRQRKGDLELEQQLAMALESTAAAAAAGSAGAQAGGSPAGAGKGGAAGSGTTPAALATRPSGGAAFSSRQPDAGRHWVEVFCGSREAGRWVHADPLTGWLDREREVEGLQPRGKPLTYVVAFMGGGARDLTSKCAAPAVAAAVARLGAAAGCVRLLLALVKAGECRRPLKSLCSCCPCRYTSNGQEASKHRDGEWWEPTLKPLVARQQRAVGVTLATVGSPPAPRGDGAGPSPAVAATATPNGSARQRQQQQQREREEAETAKLVAAREEAELSQRAQLDKRGVPTTIGEAHARGTAPDDRGPCPHAHRTPGPPAHPPSPAPDGFRSHPEYLLERHIGKYEGLRPEARKLGLHRCGVRAPGATQRCESTVTGGRLHKNALPARPLPPRRGEPYYLRKEVETLYTPDRWKRLGFEVGGCVCGSMAWVGRRRGAASAPALHSPARLAHAAGAPRGAALPCQARQEARREQGSRAARGL